MRRLLNRSLVHHPLRPSLTLALAVALAWSASANSGIRNAWQARYPSSQSYQASSCALCHASNSQTSRYNTYGYAIKQRLDMGASNTAAFQFVEGLNSDGDPGGATSLFEIMNHTQPGWTEGANNTTYTGSGTATTGVTAPATISGPLDPSLTVGTNYCGPAVLNSSGASATISASGSRVASNNDLTLTAESMPTGAFGFFLTSRTQGLVANPGGSQGNLCLSGSIGRYVGPGQIKNSGSTGSFSLVLDLTQVPQPIGLVAVQAGETWSFTCWFRDSVAGTATSNFTNGLAVSFL